MTLALALLKSKWLSFGAALALALLGTWFFHVHESLPAAIRAPSSLLLAPIAIIDGACYYLGLPGIYGNNVRMAIAMLAFAWPVAEVIRWWANRRLGIRLGSV